MRWLKGWTLALLAYVAVAFTLQLDWWQIARAVVWPQLPGGHARCVDGGGRARHDDQPVSLLLQAAQEMEDTRNGTSPPTASSVRHLSRIKIDTVGMTFSNAIAFFIILSTAVTLHQAACSTSRHPRKPPRRCGRWPVK